MSSDRRRTAAASASAAALLCLALPFASACGKQGDPSPRPRPVPQPASDLALQFRGEEALLAFSYPAASLAGLPLPPLQRVVVFEARRPLAPGATKLNLSPAEMEALGRPVVVLEGAALTGAITGPHVRVGVPLAPEAFADGEARAWAVRTEALPGEPSPFSNIVSGLLHRPPATPEGVEAKATPTGVELSWQPVEGAGGYAVLRRPSTEPAWGPPVATVAADVRTHLDRTATYGERYVYTVVALAAGDPPTQSLPRYEREVDYRDVFPPAAPRGLRAVALADEVRLVWEASPDADLAGYLVERSVGGGEFARLGEQAVDELEHSDRTAPAGQPLAYRVVAVDRTGNVSPPSATAEVRRR